MSSIVRKLTLLLCVGTFLFIMTGCTESQQQLDQARMDFDLQMRQLEQDYQLQLSQLEWDRQRYFLDRDLELRQPDEPKPEDEPKDEPEEEDKPKDEPEEEDKPKDEIPPINYTLNDVTVELTWQQLVQILNITPFEKEDEIDEPVTEPVVEPLTDEIEVAEVVEEGPTDQGMRSDDDVCLGEGTVELTDMEEK